MRSFSSLPITSGLILGFGSLVGVLITKNPDQVRTLLLRFQHVIQSFYQCSHLTNFLQKSILKQSQIMFLLLYSPYFMMLSTLAIVGLDAALLPASPTICGRSLFIWLQHHQNYLHASQCRTSQSCALVLLNHDSRLAQKHFGEFARLLLQRDGGRPSGPLSVLLVVFFFRRSCDSCARVSARYGGETFLGNPFRVGAGKIKRKGRGREREMLR